MCADQTSRNIEERAQVARLRLAVARLARQIRTNAVGGLTLSQLSALATLDRRGPLPPARLAEYEGVGRSTLTRLIRALEDRELIRREPDPADGRASILTVTSAGSQLLKESRDRADTFLAQRVANLDPNQRDRLDELSELLEQLREGE